MTAAQPACLGKLPIHGDFVRWNHNVVPEIVEFDGWLQEGMERGYEARGRGFEADLRELPVLCFVYPSPRTNRVLVGLVAPSQDQVGRVYPFTLAVALAPEAPGPQFDRLPLAAAAVLDAALELLGSAPASTLADFLQRLSALAVELDDNAAAQALRGYLFGTTLDQVFDAWEMFAPPARRAQFWQELRQLMRPPFPPRYAAAWPCRADRGEVAFWLTLLRAWLPLHRNPSLVLWPARADRQGTMRVAYDELHARYFAPMLWPRRPAQHLLDLGRQLVAREAAPGGEIALLRPRALLQDVVMAASRE